LELERVPTMGSDDAVPERLQSAIKTPAVVAERCHAGVSKKGESLVPGERLTRDYERAHDEHQRAVAALIPLLVRMALESVAEVLPGTQRLEVCGEVNEDWVPILRIQRVLGAEATVLFDVAVGHDERAVEDVIDDVNSEYLDVLLDLSGDDFMGAQTIDTATAEP